MANEEGFKYTKNFASILEGTDFCEHVTDQSLDKAVGYFYERDSFGFVAARIVCEECKTAIQKEIDAELVYCHDCKKELPRGETIEWRWHDFYAPQGDEPYIICNTCRFKETHIQRKAQDEKAYEDDWDE